MFSQNVFLFTTFYLMITGSTAMVDIRKNRQMCINDVTSSKITCQFLTSLSSLPKNPSKSLTKLVIRDSKFKGSDEVDPLNIKNEFKFLREVHFINSFLGPEAIVWLNRLENVETIVINSCWNGNVTVGGLRRQGLRDDVEISVLNLDLSSLSRLRSLEVSMCNLTNLQVNPSVSTPKLWLSDNWFECLNDFVWLFLIHEKEDSSNYLSLFNTTCFIEKFFNSSENYPMQYTLNEKPFLLVMKYRKEALTNCPPKCSCDLFGMRRETPQLYVNCVAVNMTKMPSIIPEGSNRLDLRRNMIEDISPVYDTPMYKSVTMFKFSHNRINYLDPVLFPRWLSERADMGITLDHNQLTHVPAKQINKVLSDLLDQNPYIPRFIFDHNPYLCTCDYIDSFQKMIYHYLLKDGDVDIRCSEEDSYNANKSVLSVDVDALCPKKPVLALVDLVNFSLALILFFLIINFIFNYYMYRKYQKLPWIITKLRF